MLLSLALLLAAAATAEAQAFSVPPINAKGKQPLHGSFSVLPWESIDMLSGNLVLTFTDLVLPGYNGMDLRIGRALNSGGEAGGRRWFVGVMGPVALTLSDPVNPNPTIEWWDGGVEHTYETAVGSGTFMTLGFARLTRSTRALELPDGTVCEFDEQVNAWVWKITRRSDQFGNAIEYSYDEASGALELVTQRLGSDTRTVALDHQGIHWTFVDGTGAQHTRSWVYRWDGWDLREVTPPVGPSWYYDYDDSLPDDAQAIIVTTPEGGRVTYRSEWQDGPLSAYPPKAPLFRRLALTARTTGGRGVVPGTWSFAYSETSDISLTGSFFGTVVRPDNSSVEYVHFRTMAGENYSTRSPLQKVTVQDVDGSTVEVSTYDWREDVVPGWRDLGMMNQIPPSVVEPARPFLIRNATVVRGGVAYSTDYAYCQEPNQANTCDPDVPYDGGAPRVVTERGDFERTRTYTYHHYRGDDGGQSTYLLARVASETVAQSGAPGAFTSAWEYDGLGFMYRENVRGVATTYTRDAQGNRVSSTLVNNIDAPFVVGYTYRWGVPETITTPKYIETRTINPDGTMAALEREAQSGQPDEGNNARQSWDYDALGRVTTQVPRTWPDGAATVTNYDGLANGDIVISRHTSRVTRYVDGYGRPTGTRNSVGVETAIAYNQLGYLEKESAPFEPEGNPIVARRDSSYEYDALGRVTRKTRPDGTTVTYEYDGRQVQTIEQVGWIGEDDRVTLQTWEAAGDPRAARLTTVRDGLTMKPEGEIVSARETWTTYRYDALDALVAVCGPSADPVDPCTATQATRTWTYDPATHHLSQERHPESGTTSYTYRTDGLRRSRTDADGRLTLYGYDHNNRLDGEREDGPSGPLTAWYEYDIWDNRTKAGSRDATTYYVYRGGIWLVRRTDTVLATNEAFTSQYDHDPAGNLVCLHYPSKVGRAINYDYDAEGRVTGVVDDQTEHAYASQVRWHPSGALRQYTAGNGLVHQVTFDEVTARPAATTSGPLSLSYAYDSTGSVREIGDGRSGHGQQLGYDALDRLEDAAGIWGALTFSYRPSGDRATVERRADGTTATTTYDYDEVTGRLRSMGGAVTGSFAYRPTGHVERDPAGEYEYTGRGMLKQARLNSGVMVFYTYDAEDRRTTKTVSGTRTVYLHDGAGQLLSEYQQRGVGRDYLYLGGRLLAAIVGTIPAPPPVCDVNSAPGTECADGTIVAGSSPDGNEMLFTTPADAELRTFVFPTDVTVGATSFTTGEANTALLAAAATGGAAEYCAALVAHGKEDWYLPAVQEMQVLQQHAEAIGGFTPDPGTYYWTSTEKIAEDYTAGYFVRIGDGWTGHTGKGKRFPFRCVRRGGGSEVLNFGDRSGVALGTTMDSNIVRMTSAGGATVPVSVSAGEFRVCPDAACASVPPFGSITTTIGEGQYLQLRVTSSPLFSTPVQVAVTVGTLAATWTVTTLAQDGTPNPFAFTHQSGVAPGVVVDSNVVAITGITGQVTVAVTIPGMHRVCPDATCAGVPFVATDSPIGEGQFLQLRQTSAATEGTPASVTVSVGAASVTWTVTTAGDICEGTPPVGAVCANGSVYAGYSPDGNVRMYTTAEDAGHQRFEWPETTGHGYTDRTTGQANTLGMAQYAGYDAVSYCANLDAHGTGEWYLPGQYEMDVLYANREAIGGFDLDPATYYWTAREHDTLTGAYYHRMDGVDGYTGKGIAFLMRCVWREMNAGEFHFADQSGVDLNVEVASNILRVTGLRGSANVSVAGAGASYRVCTAPACAGAPPFVTAPSAVRDGEYVQLSLITADGFAATASATVTIGRLSDVWQVTTASQDVAPNAFTFADQTGAPLSVPVISNVVLITGITGSVSTSVSGGAYRVCGDASCSAEPPFTAAASAIANGQYLQLRQTSAATAATAVTTTVMVGSGSESWTVTTQGDPCAGAPAPGTGCADGSRYAGLSPDGNRKMYTTVTDAGAFRFEWPETTGHGYTDRTAGEANTLGMAAYAGYAAARYCAALVAYGKDDWYLPGQYEMDVLHANRVAIGNFTLDPATYYWTAREHAEYTGAYYHRMDGVDGYTGKGIANRIRCVRKD